MESIPDPTTTILILHDTVLDPFPFLSRLTRTDCAGDVVPWAIDNKYYTADIAFRICKVEEYNKLEEHGPPNYPVLLYLFSGNASNPLPAALTRLSVNDHPPDIALAVRVQYTLNADASSLLKDDEDRFFDIGFDVFDEHSSNDDDERPIDNLENIRQTLMTHMWPNMKRKPVGKRDTEPPELAPLAAFSVQTSTDDTYPFPVDFTRSTPVSPRPAGRAQDFPTPTADSGSRSTVRAEIPEGWQRLGEGDADDLSLTAKDDAFNELENWLEGEEGDSDTSNMISGPDGGFEAEDSFGEFEDNFEDNLGVAPISGGFPVDPTPMIIHLQNIRHQLATIADDDERRMRAGHEVNRLMESLGFDHASYELDDL